jgi:hypothetical protein
MRTLGTLLAATAVFGMGLSAVPAEARDGRRGHHGYYKHQGKHWHGRHHGKRWHGRHHRRTHPGVALGVLGGALAGAAIASAAYPYYYYPYSYSYSYPYYGYYYPY